MYFIFFIFFRYFYMNTIWDNLIKENNLLGEVIGSKITHIGEKKSFEEN